MITIQVNDTVALKSLRSLEQKRHISIIENAIIDSPSLPGAPISLKAFKAWIAEAENAPTISLQEAKRKWAEKRKRLLKLTR
jgi:hypothetical protein